MNQLTKHLAHLSMTLICFFSLLSTSSQVLRSHIHKATCTPHSLLTSLWFHSSSSADYCRSLMPHFLPCSQICPTPQPLRLQSPVCTVPAHTAPPVWSDHHNRLCSLNMLFLSGNEYCFLELLSSFPLLELELRASPFFPSKRSPAQGHVPARVPALFLQLSQLICPSGPSQDPLWWSVLPFTSPPANASHLHKTHFRL